jgi:hypothetical protein
VDAVARDPRSKELDQLKVIIESKGCWNPEIKTAMETQFLNRYLKDNDCSHGIYLVGWFLCDAWSKTHPRSAEYRRARQKANSYVQPSVFDMLAGASPASAMDGWAE